MQKPGGEGIMTLGNPLRPSLGQIQLDVENGLPADANYTTVTIHQYGYEHYLEWGQIISFDTDRTLANSNTMKLNISHMENLVEADWGDNGKEVYSTKDSYRTLTKFRTVLSGETAFWNWNSKRCLQFLIPYG